MTNPAGFYVPGHARAKAAMAMVGLLVFLLGLWQIKTPLRLLFFGQRATAEAVDVVKSKEGLPDLILHDDLQVQANVETRDRSYIFWNDFRFTTAEGRTLEVRAPVGSRLKPLYSLLDDDGLPTSDAIYYDPRDPATVVFPWIISTWFAPGALIVIGLLDALIGAVLLYWANRPIALPHVPETSARKKDET
jgi:xanthosine utilization system XapX-like protein